jgi:hypothetical protein
MLVLLVSIFFTAGNALTSDTSSAVSKANSCLYPCLSIVVLNTDCSNCSGTYCGTGVSSTPFTTDGNGQFILPCRCAGTYYFCIDNTVYSVTVDGSGNTFYAAQTGGLCPCGGK